MKELLEEVKAIRELLEWQKQDILEMRAKEAERAEQQEAVMKALQDRMIEEQLAAGRKLQEEQAAIQRTLQDEGAAKYRAEAEQLYRKNEAGYHKGAAQTASTDSEVPA